MSLSFFASCPKNIEDLLEEEILSSGGIETLARPSGVEFSGSLESAYRLCLWSRTASRVYIRIASAGVTGAGDVYGLVEQTEWKEHLDPRGTLAVEVTTTGSGFPDTPDYTALKVKDGIADYFTRTAGNRPSVNTSSPDLLVHAHIDRGTVSLSVDLSGGSLHRRGYRTTGGAAPLKENSAAAVLLRARWPEFASKGLPLLDPMCGSGTLLIEGALIAGDIAPGLLRSRFGFETWRGHDIPLWRRLRDEAAERKQAGQKAIPPIFGFDVDRKAVEISGANAAAAGLEACIRFERASFTAMRLPRSILPGLIVTNPPYGKRIGSDAGEKLPEELGNTLKGSFSGWTAAILTPDEDFQKSAGMKAHHRNTLYNGPIRCRLYHFEIFTPRKREELTEQAGEDYSPGAGMFANRLKKNMKHLSRWRESEGIHCYRLYDADMPEYAVALDVYEDVFGKRRVHLQEYAPPPEIEPEKAMTRFKDACTVVRRELGISREDLFLKTRTRQRGSRQYARLSEAGERYEIMENGLRFYINLSDYLDTGLFLDHRITRELIRSLARGSVFLNLFAYTGTASVYAAAGGAAETTSVDTSQTYLDWAGDNMLLNGIRGRKHRFVRNDSFDFLKNDRGFYDLIFIDPPTFSNSKDRRGTFDIQRDHPAIIRMASRRLRPGGYIIFSTNAGRFKPEFEGESGLFSREITDITLPPDFARSKTKHRCWLLSGRPLDRLMERKPKTVYDLIAYLKGRRE